MICHKHMRGYVSVCLDCHQEKEVTIRAGIRLRGQRAFEAGTPVTACPFDDVDGAGGPSFGNLWLQGWYTAQATKQLRTNHE